MDYNNWIMIWERMVDYMNIGDINILLNLFNSLLYTKWKVVLHVKSDGSKKFSVVRVTLELQMIVCLSICLSVTKTLLPLRFMPISHYFHLPSISHHAYCISAIIVHIMHMSYTVWLNFWVEHTTKIHWSDYIWHWMVFPVLSLL